MKFAINDHVRVIARTCRYFDEVGTVTDISDDEQEYPLHISGLEDHPLWCAAHELVLAERPIAAEEGISL